MRKVDVGSEFEIARVEVGPESRASVIHASARWVLTVATIVAVFAALIVAMLVGLGLVKMDFGPVSAVWNVVGPFVGAAYGFFFRGGRSTS